MSTSLSESSRYYTDCNIPPRLGIIDDIEYFDATFFGIQQKQVRMQNPEKYIIKLARIEHKS